MKYIFYILIVLISMCCACTQAQRKPAPLAATSWGSTYLLDFEARDNRQLMQLSNGTFWQTQCALFLLSDWHEGDAITLRLNCNKLTMHEYPLLLCHATTKQQIPIQFLCVDQEHEPLRIEVLLLQEGLQFLQLSDGTTWHLPSALTTWHEGDPILVAANTDNAKAPALLVNLTLLKEGKRTETFRPATLL